MPRRQGLPTPITRGLARHLRLKGALPVATVENADPPEHRGTIASERSDELATDVPQQQRPTERWGSRFTHRPSSSDLDATPVAHGGTPLSTRHRGRSRGTAPQGRTPFRERPLTHRRRQQEHPPQPPTVTNEANNPPHRTTPPHRYQPEKHRGSHDVSAGGQVDIPGSNRVRIMHAWFAASPNIVRHHAQDPAHYAAPSHLMPPASRE